MLSLQVIQKLGCIRFATCTIPNLWSRFILLRKQKYLSLKETFSVQMQLFPIESFYSWVCFSSFSKTVSNFSNLKMTFALVEGGVPE